MFLYWSSSALEKENFLGGIQFLEEEKKFTEEGLQQNTEFWLDVTFLNIHV